MKHCMAVWADGPEILDRIHRVLGGPHGQRAEVMNVNEAGPYRAIPCFEVEGTNCARHTIVLNTSLARLGTALVGINQNLLNGSLRIPF